MKNSLGTLAAVAALATAAQLDAAVIVSPVQDQVIPSDSYIFVDLTGDGTDDFYFNGHIDMINSQWGGSGAITHFVASGWDLVGLNAGDIVNAGAPEFNSQVSFGHLLGGGTVYAGFSLLIDGNIHYGWLELAFDTDGTNTLVRAAWESVAGEGIVVGAIPEPTTVGLASGLVAAAAVLAHRRLRRRSS